jgi:serine/threonine protein kinase
MMIEKIGHYRITGKLGEGGMGIVYAASDERLDRPVAIKTLRSVSATPEARERLFREARLAACVNHPGICHLYEIGEDNGALYLAMELLEGESLASRLGRGPLPISDAIPIVVAVLCALQALHGRDLVHRDLKPSNIFLTPNGVKLLDFGVACRTESPDTETRLTLPGMVIGTPQYLPPEQLRGEPVDARSDLFSTGIVLYEMLTGTLPFAGGPITQVIHSIMYDTPPPLGGSPAAEAVDRVIQRALAKRPQDRYQTADAMAEELRGAALEEPVIAPARPRPVTRLIVLPFRILRQDPDTDFLSFSLPDALTSSLSGLESLTVRSTLTASRGGETDLETVAAKADVDVVLTGTLLRAGDQLRVTTELVEVPKGTVLWSQTSQAKLGDVFQLQDDLRDRILESLSVPLTAREQRMLKHDVPSNARAYELYLRANQVAYDTKNRLLARDLYLECLAEDSRYAPAWARLGRIYRVIALSAGAAGEADYRRAQDAFTRALELNPDLPVAHNLYTYLEVESGRGKEAMLRLLARAAKRPADPDLFAGLVQAARYCGLLDASIAGHREARRFDPHIRTSVSHAYLMAGDYERAIDADDEDVRMVSALARELMGERDRAIALLRDSQKPGMPRVFFALLESNIALLEGRLEDSRKAMDDVLKALGAMRDPCGMFYLSRHLAMLGDPRALPMFRNSVEKGFFCFTFYQHDPGLDSLRGQPEFEAVLRTAEERHQDALRAFRDAGGDRILNRRTTAVGLK